MIIAITLSGCSVMLYQGYSMKIYKEIQRKIRPSSNIDLIKCKANILAQR